MPPAKGAAKAAEPPEVEAPKVDYAAKAAAYQAYVEKEVNPLIFDALSRLEDAVEYDMKANMLQRPADPLTWIGTYLMSNQLKRENSEMKMAIKSLRTERAEVEAAVKDKAEKERALSAYWASFDSVPLSWKTTTRGTPGEGEEEGAVDVFDVGALEHFLPAALEHLEDRSKLWATLLEEKLPGDELSCGASAEVLEKWVQDRSKGGADAPPRAAAAPEEAAVEGNAKALFPYARRAFELAFDAASSPAADATAPKVVKRASFRLFAAAFQTACVLLRAFEVAGLPKLVKPAWKAHLPALNLEFQRHLGPRAKLKPKDFGKADVEANDEITSEDAIQYILSVYAETDSLAKEES